MSSNYRILLYFLSTLDESIRTGLGLRNTANFYRQLNNAKNRNNRSGSKVNVEKIENSKSTGNRPNQPKKFNYNSVPENVSIVLEGIQQYASYVSKRQIPPQKNSLFPSSVNRHQSVTSAIPNVSKINDNYIETIQFKNDSKFEESLDLTKDSIKEHGQFYGKLSDNSKERKVPSNRASRVLSFGGLAVGLGIGALEELTKRMVGSSNSTKNESILGSSLFLSESNAIKIVDTLCRVRGAALKLGQMLSIQDNEVVGPEIQAIFERVRQSADHMPITQMHQVMAEQLGQQWREHFQEFDDKPFAAASIGQVHRARLLDGTDVAVKIQYPGVAESIESDIKNVLTILKYSNIFPEGLFIDHIMSYAKKELGWEVDYIREAKCSIQYRDLVKQYCDPADRFYVPNVFVNLSSKRVIISELIHGVPVDKLDDFRETSLQSLKNSIAQRLMKLFFQELFIFNYMQTDPNWSNFFYDYQSDTISLIDFGSSRPYSREFVQKYFDIIQSAIDNDRDMVLKKSLDIGFLSGYESEVFKSAHVDSVMIVGEAIREPDLFDFGQQSVTKRIHNLVPVMLEHRLKPPPEEIYSLHRKLSGLFLLFTKLKVEINCRNTFEQSTGDYRKNN